MPMGVVSRGVNCLRSSWSFFEKNFYRWKDQYMSLHQLSKQGWHSWFYFLQVSKALLCSCYVVNPIFAQRLNKFRVIWTAEASYHFFSALLVMFPCLNSFFFRNAISQLLVIRHEVGRLIIIHLPQLQLVFPARHRPVLDPARPLGMPRVYCAGDYLHTAILKEQRPQHAGFIGGIGRDFCGKILVFPLFRRTRPPVVFQLDHDALVPLVRQ